MKKQIVINRADLAGLIVRLELLRNNKISFVFDNLEGRHMMTKFFGKIQSAKMYVAILTAALIVTAVHVRVSYLNMAKMEICLPTRMANALAL